MRRLASLYWKGRGTVSLVCTRALANVHLPGYVNDAVEFPLNIWIDSHFFAMSAMDRCSLLQYLCHKGLCKGSVVRGNVFKLVFFYPTVASFFDRREREIRIDCWHFFFVYDWCFLLTGQSVVLRCTLFAVVNARWTTSKQKLLVLEPLWIKSTERTKLLLVPPLHSLRGNRVYDELQIVTEVGLVKQIIKILDDDIYYNDNN